MSARRAASRPRVTTARVVLPDDVLRILYAIAPRGSSAAHPTAQQLHQARDIADGGTVTLVELRGLLSVLDHIVEHGHPVLTTDAADWAGRRLRIALSGVAGTQIRLHRHDPARDHGVEPRLERP